MTDNTQIVIRKNGVEIAILNEVLSSVFLQVIKKIDEERDNPLRDEIILKKNKRIEFSPDQVFVFLHNVVFNLCVTQKQDIEGIRITAINSLDYDEEDEDIDYDDIEDENIENKLDQFEFLNYDLSTIENLLASFIYSEKKNKKNEWTYCIENLTITMEDIFQILDGEEETDDISE